MAQAGAAAQAVYTQGSCARLMLVTMEARSGLGQAETRVPTESLTAAMDQQQGHAGLQLRLKLECKQGQWRLGYYSGRDWEGL